MLQKLKKLKNMAHPILHAKSNQKKFGGKWEDYIHLHNWMDETKGWYGHSFHRIFRHHSEGIFEGESKFGSHFTNSDGKIVYTRYCLESHVKEDCDGYIPTAREWIMVLETKQRPTWVTKTQKLEFED